MKKNLLVKSAALALSAVLLAGCSAPAAAPATTAAPAATTAAAAPAATTAAPAATTAAPTEAPAEAQLDWPKETIEVVATAKAGGTNDLIARAYARELEKKLGVSVIVTNMASGGQAPAIYYVHDSANPEYTILNTHDAFFINEVQESIDFGMEDMSLLGITAKVPGQILWARAESGWKTLDDFKAACDADPGKLTLSLSYGSTTQVMGEMLIAAGVQAKAVDSDGGSDRVIQLEGGHVDTAILGWDTGSSYFEAGQWIPLCIFDDERCKDCPDVPTAKELGYDASWPTNYTWSMAPGVDGKIVKKLQDTLAEIAADPAFIEEMDGYSVNAVFEPAEESLPKLLEGRDAIAKFLS